MTECYTCQLVARRDEGAAPLWDNIYRTAYWDVVHSYNTAVPGWLVLVSRRHVAAIAELNEAEAAEVGVLMRRLSLILEKITGCAKTYVMQFAEHAQHPHVHFHVVPRLADQPEDRRGPQIMKYLGVPEEERVSEEQMNDIGLRVRQMLQLEE